MWTMIKPTLIFFITDLAQSSLKVKEKQTGTAALTETCFWFWIGAGVVDINTAYYNLHSPNHYPWYKYSLLHSPNHYPWYKYSLLHSPNHYPWYKYSLLHSPNHYGWYKYSLLHSPNHYHCKFVSTGQNVSLWLCIAKSGPFFQYVLLLLVF